MRLRRRWSEHEGRAEQASKRVHRGLGVLTQIAQHDMERTSSTTSCFTLLPLTLLPLTLTIPHDRMPIPQLLCSNVCVWCSHSMCVCGVPTHELTVSQVVVGRFGHVAFGMSSDCWVLACSILPLIRYRIFTYDICVYVRACVCVCVCVYVCMYV